MKPEVSRRIYSAYLAIFDMDLKIGIRRTMLSWALAENPDHWPVVGITRSALERFAEHDFRYVSRMGVNRSHLVDRKVWQSAMLEKRLSFNEWVELYERSDRTVLATSSENMRGEVNDFITLPKGEGLFRSVGYKWRHTAEEREVLSKLHKQLTKKVAQQEC
jgi:hypothetical protein